MFLLWRRHSAIHAADAVFPHPGLQGRALEAESRGCAGGPPTCPLASFSASRMRARFTASETFEARMYNCDASAGKLLDRAVTCGMMICNSGPLLKMTDRSMRFCCKRG